MPTCTNFFIHISELRGRQLLSFCTSFHGKNGPFHFWMSAILTAVHVCIIMYWFDNFISQWYLCSWLQNLIKSLFLHFVFVVWTFWFIFFMSITRSTDWHKYIVILILWSTEWTESISICMMEDWFLWHPVWLWPPGSLEGISILSNIILRDLGVGGLHCRERWKSSGLW